MRIIQAATEILPHISVLYDLIVRGTGVAVVQYGGIMSGSADTCVRHMPAPSHGVYILQKASLCFVFWIPRAYRAHYGLMRLRTYLAYIPQHLNFFRGFYHPTV